MSKPTLTPASTLSKTILPSTGNVDGVLVTLPYGIYTGQTFLEGAKDQCAHVYKKLGGDVVDIELTEGNVYAAYEEAVLEYSYIINVHQAKNSLGDLLGNTTASFDQDGEIKDGDALQGKQVELKYPKYTFEVIQRNSKGIGQEAGAGGDMTYYSASFTPSSNKQVYDLQSIVSSSITDGTIDLQGADTDFNLNKKVTVRQVYFKTPRSMWRFFAYYGGLNVIGNLSSYGQYADDSQFEVIPAWMNKLQAIQYEDSLNTRISQYSFSLQNNNLYLYPVPSDFYPTKMWVKFTIDRDAWDEQSDRRDGVTGINNMNTLPFSNIPYESINSIGKQWIRRFALALCKEMLGQIRGKFGGTIPIPGDSITLNSSDLLGQAKAEQDALREELKTVLDELTYARLAEKNAKMMDDTTTAQKTIPIPVFVG